MESCIYSPPNLNAWRPRVQVIESSAWYTVLLKLCVTMLFPMLLIVPLPGLVGVPPPKSRPKRPTSELGFELGIPIVWPKAPTEGSQVDPVLRIMWFQPKRASLTKVLEMTRVQSPTALQMGAVTWPFAKRGCELVEGSVCIARVKRPEI